MSGFCCQAAGGNPEIAGPLVAAWYLFNRAAHIMDSVQDNDEPEDWWADAGSGVALSAASGLFFTASKILSGLETYGIDPGPAGLVRQTFSGTLLKMSAGQYDDLVTEVPTLEQYWRLIELKSGIFFSLASRAGAQLALQDPARLDAFETFGLEIGLLVQILDDLEDYQVDESMQLPFLMNSDSRRSLPVVYALNMYPPATRQLLLQDLQQAKEDRQSAQEAWDLIEACGAGLYVKMEIESHHQKALQALDLAQPLPVARQELIDLLNELIA